MFGLVNKKGAMFGKLSQLDHNNLFANKKGAMFGLDARIALAIFGALSVISGAALYSAIQQSKVVAVVTELDNLSKAISGFMLDTGLDLTITNTNFYIADLLDNPNSIPGWKGPYFPQTGDLKGTNTREYMEHPIYGSLYIRYLEDNLGLANYAGCTTSPCYYWLQLDGMDESLANAIDKYVDSSDSKDSGNVRVINVDTKNVFIKGPLMLKQP